MSIFDIKYRCQSLSLASCHFVLIVVVKSRRHNQARSGEVLTRIFVPTISSMVILYGSLATFYFILPVLGKASRHNQKWRGSDENIRANLQQYGLSQYYLDALVADASIHSMWNLYSMFDAIITDRKYSLNLCGRYLHLKGELKAHIHISLYESNTLIE